MLCPSESREGLIKRSLVLIGWGQRHYLIPPDEIQELRDAIIDGREPRDDLHGRLHPAAACACRWVTRLAARVGERLCEGLLLGRVMKVSAAGIAKIGRVKLDLGAEDGLREGDILTVQKHGHHLNRRLRIVSVADRSCVADKCFPGSSEHPLEVGLAVVAVRSVGPDGPR